MVMRAPGMGSPLNPWKGSPHALNMRCDKCGWRSTYPPKAMGGDIPKKCPKCGAEIRLEPPIVH